MSPAIKELTERPICLTEGHRLCPGCAEPTIARQVLMATDKPVVISNATGCFEVSTTGYPYSAWNVPWIHSAFENAAATISGVEAAYRVMRRQGKITDEMRFVCFAGDGGTYDIGFQALSGAIERGHQFLFVCLNNEAYMNTGIQRSGATGMGASTTTSPAGTRIPGKKEFPEGHYKDHSSPWDPICSTSFATQLEGSARESIQRVRMWRAGFPERRLPMSERMEIRFCQNDRAIKVSCGNMCLAAL